MIVLDYADQQVDGVSWGASSAVLDPPVHAVLEQHSVERSPAYRDTDHAADWIDQDLPTLEQVDLSAPTPTPTSAAFTPTPPGLPTLLLSEVLYDPQGALDPDGEWVEIYNYGTHGVSLGEIKLGDEETLAVERGCCCFRLELLCLYRV